MKQLTTAAMAVLLAGSASLAAAQENLVSLSVGAEYSIGAYAQPQDTKMWYYPIAAKYERGPVTLRLTMAYLEVTGPSAVIAGDRVSVVQGNVRPANESVGGFGDTVAGITYNLWNDAATGLILDVTGKVKFGTADRAKFLGTGETDYYLQGDIAKSWGRFSLFGTLGYKWYGDVPLFIDSNGQPAGPIDFDNIFYATAGATWKFSSQFTAGMAYDWREKALPTSPQISEISPFAVYKFTDAQKLTAYAVIGLADGSPDFAGGLVYGYSFGF